MKVLIGAIGTNDYQGVEYRFSDGETSPARFFMVALAKKVSADQVIVLLTEDAKTLQWNYKDGTGLKDEFEKAGIRATPVDIPKGLSEAEAWEIFTKVSAEVPEEADVVLDVTHGLRSIPFLLLLSINYLRAVRNARILDIYYGALEGTSKEDKTKPAFSLGNFVTLLDWSVGVDNFRRNGDLEKLASLLEERQTIVRREAPETSSLPSRLKSVANWLRKLSVALDLTRPDEVMENSAQLIREIKEAEQEFPVWAKPFSLLLTQINQSFAPLALPDSRSRSNLSQNVERQYKLVKWYLDKARYQSAIVLLREWFTSWRMKEGRDPEIFDKRAREKFEDQLFEPNAEGVTDAAIIGTFKEISDLRNDVAHVGMRAVPEKAITLKKRLEKAIHNIEKLKP